MSELKSVAKVTIIIERNGEKVRFKKKFKKGESAIGRVGEFMLKLQEDSNDEKVAG